MYLDTYTCRRLSAVMASGWSADETRALVSIWGEASVLSKLDMVERIARRLEELGYERTWLTEADQSSKAVQKTIGNIVGSVTVHVSTYIALARPLAHIAPILYTHVNVIIT